MGKRNKIGQFADYIDSQKADANAAVMRYAVARGLTLGQAYDELLQIGISRAATLDRYARRSSRRSVDHPRLDA